MESTIGIFAKGQNDIFASECLLAQIGSDYKYLNRLDIPIAAAAAAAAERKVTKFLRIDAR